MVSFTLNGRPVSADADRDMPLLWVLRDVLGLAGAKYGCGIGACGACTVLVDGVARPSCVLALADVSGKRIVTIEGAAGVPLLRRLQEAWIAEQVPQCGYCQAGMILAAASLLAAKPKPGDADIDAAMRNLCRCGTYPRVRAAIRRAAGA